MADILVRDVPDEVVAAVDATARRQGISRTELIRRLLAQQGAHGGAPDLSGEDFHRFSETFRDLGDPEVMRGAWE